MTKANYNVAQGVLYGILEMAWDNFDLYQGQFTAYKGSYGAPTSAAGRALIDAAEYLPDEESRGEAAETLRIELVPLGKVCTLNFQKLKGYIRSAYAETVWKPKLEAAGQNYYTAATNEDWESVKSLNNAMNLFITANSGVLSVDLATAGPNMPGTFPTDVTTAATNFGTKYTSFINASNTSTATAAKINANNAAFDAVTKTMFDDAQVIFVSQPEIAKLFVFENLQQMIDPQTQGIKGKVLNADTNVFEDGVTVTIQKPGLPAVTAVTAVQGRFKVIQQGEGEHTVVISKAGFIPITQTIKFKVGTVIRRDFVLQKAP